MSEWNYTKCAKPFNSQAEAREFMVSKNFAGHILRRADGTYTAVCPTYPEGYYPDAVGVETVAGGISVVPRSGAAAQQECCESA